VPCAAQLQDPPSAADRRVTDAKLTAPIRHDQPSDDSEADARAQRVGVDLLAQFGL
jgi:hypothetical protein